MAIQNPYDHALKILARTWPGHFLRLGFPNQSFNLLGTTANVEVALEIDRVDFLHEAEVAGKRFYYHIDFQLEHEDDCRRRFFVYNGMLTELYKPTPVITLPVYLKPRVKALPDRYEVKIGDVVFHSFTYRPILLADYVEQIRSGEMYIFAPLLPLLAAPATEDLLVEERDLILNHEPDPQRQRTLLTTAILIAGHSKLFNLDFLWDLFRRDNMDVDNPIIAKLFEKYHGDKLVEIDQRIKEKDDELHQANQRAHEAEAEAARQWQELMLKILEHRFRSVPVALVLLLQAIPPALRSQVSDLILGAPDADQCLQAVRALQANQPTQ